MSEVEFTPTQLEKLKMLEAYIDQAELEDVLEDVHESVGHLFESNLSKSTDPGAATALIMWRNIPAANKATIWRSIAAEAVVESLDLLVTKAELKEAENKATVSIEPPVTPTIPEAKSESGQETPTPD